MIKDTLVLTRHSAPTHLDTAERGVLCKVSESLGETEYYVQMSSNPESPTWIKLESKTVEDAEKEFISLISS